MAVVSELLFAAFCLYVASTQATKGSDGIGEEDAQTPSSDADALKLEKNSNLKDSFSEESSTEEIIESRIEGIERE